MSTRDANNNLLVSGDSVEVVKVVYEKGTKNIILNTGVKTKVVNAFSKTHVDVYISEGSTETTVCPCNKLVKICEVIDETA